MDREAIILYDFVKRQKDVPDYNSPDPIIEIDPNASRISFLSLNNLLHGRFFNICCPILRRCLFLSSRKTIEIKCQTYVSNDTWFQNRNYSFSQNSGTISKPHLIANCLLLVKPDLNAVIEIRCMLSLNALREGDISKYFPDHIFHHSALRIVDSKLNTEEMEMIFNQNVISFIYVGYPEEDEIFTNCLERMPNLKNLYYKVERDIPNLVSGLFNWKQTSKLAQLYIACGHQSISNIIQFPELLFKFMTCQEEYFSVKFEYQDDKNLQISEDFLEYFCEINEWLNDERCLVFKNIKDISTFSHYFKLKDC